MQSFTPLQQPSRFTDSSFQDDDAMPDLQLPRRVDPWGATPLGVRSLRSTVSLDASRPFPALSLGEDPWAEPLPLAESLADDWSFRNSVDDAGLRASRFPLEADRRRSNSVGMAPPILRNNRGSGFAPPFLEPDFEDRSLRPLPGETPPYSLADWRPSSEFGLEASLSTSARTSSDFKLDEALPLRLEATRRSGELHAALPHRSALNPNSAEFVPTTLPGKAAREAKHGASSARPQRDLLVGVCVARSLGADDAGEPHPRESDRDAEAARAALHRGGVRTESSLGVEGRDRGVLSPSGHPAGHRGKPADRDRSGCAAAAKRRGVRDVRECGGVRRGAEVSFAPFR